MSDAKKAAENWRDRCESISCLCAFVSMAAVMMAAMAFVAWLVSAASEPYKVEIITASAVFGVVGLIAGVISTRTAPDDY